MSALVKNNSFANFDLPGWFVAVCKCVVLWAGFLISLCGGQKKHNKFPLTTRAPILSIRFLYLFQTSCMVSMYLGSVIHLQLTFEAMRSAGIYTHHFQYSTKAHFLYHQSNCHAPPHYA